ncbi:MAG: glutamate--tRNA ligase [Alphaproteobacteria bacterium]|nr:MAG: glutamate--tRNA ligase [Alphaproteobacteria bacterium]
MASKANVITRFAPSPTGILHIGNARTALFNWLYARHCGGTFLLRIEDTDRARSTPEAIDAILDGLSWLGIDWDGDPIFQFARADRHREVAEELLAKGHAYKCYATPEELQEMREKARAEGRSVGYDGRWRDRDPSEAPAGVDPVIRLKTPNEGVTVIEDKVQGTVTFKNADIDDMVLLRSDGTPTYMLSVVVDDHDMGVTQIIRGDDHLSNAGRQTQLYNAMGWDVPDFAHVPLIHGPDGAKLSKRHGALGVASYREMGLLPEALRNYLLRLGWSHGDDEIISSEQAIAWFDLGGLNKAPARLDFAKMEYLNGHYIRHTDDSVLAGHVESLMADKGQSLSQEQLARVRELMPSLKERAKTLHDLVKGIDFLVAARPITIDDKVAKPLNQEGAREMLTDLAPQLAALNHWTLESVETALRAFADARELGFGKVAQPLRAALTGTPNAPGIFEVMVALGQAETLARIEDQAAAA